MKVHYIFILLFLFGCEAPTTDEKIEKESYKTELKYEYSQDYGGAVACAGEVRAAIALSESKNILSEKDLTLLKRLQSVAEADALRKGLESYKGILNSDDISLAIDEAERGFQKSYGVLSREFGLKSATVLASKKSAQHCME